MNISENKYDAIETLIFQEGLKIQSVEIKNKRDQLFIYLNNGQTIIAPISLFPKLKNASLKLLSAYKINRSGSGIRWERLDEDLSLKGFLRDELKKIVGSKDDALAA